MTASYPAAVKVFQTFQDEKDINYAADINEIHDEVVAIESTLGDNPQWTTTTGIGVTFPDVATFLRTLYAGTTPLPHTHAHESSGGGGFFLTNLNDDTHIQYLRADGTRPLTGNMGSPDPLLPIHISTKNYTDSRDQATLGSAEVYAQAVASSARDQAEAYTDAHLLNRLEQIMYPYGSVWVLGGPGWLQRFMTYFPAAQTTQYPAGDNGIGYQSSMGALKVQYGTVDGVVDAYGGMQVPTDQFKHFMQCCMVNVVWVPPGDPRTAQYPGLPVVDFSTTAAAPWDVWMNNPGANLNVVIRRFDGSYPVGYFCKIAYVLVGV